MKPAVNPIATMMKFTIARACHALLLSLRFPFASALVPMIHPAVQRAPVTRTKPMNTAKQQTSRRFPPAHRAGQPNGPVKVTATNPSGMAGFPI